MGAAKWVIVGTVTLFSAIGVAAVIKKRVKDRSTESALSPSQAVLSVPASKQASLPQPRLPAQKGGSAAPQRPSVSPKEDFPHIDRIFQLFTTTGTKLPIVETISYTSTAPWLKGRPAWLADYAVYYNTSRHFIARSLNNRPDYATQKVFEKCKFNVFRKDKKFEFHLLVDTSRCKMGFYYVDLDTNERVLLKTYPVGLGRLDPSKPSGMLTPLGRYRLGSKVAVYEKGVMGFYQGQKQEMIRIFGTRWIPMEASSEAQGEVKGYGFQGAPWVAHSSSGELVEKLDTIGAYDSDGCIRLSAGDIEEIFAIVLTRPTWVEVVKDFKSAKLPGIEVATPSR